MPEPIHLVVGAGAPAGGPAAFQRLVRSFPVDGRMAFILVAGDAPHDLGGSAGSLPLTAAHDGQRIEPDHVYVVPPDCSATVDDGMLRLSNRADAPAGQQAADGLLRSLAAQYGARSVAILASGASSVGSAGPKAVSSEGGLVLALQPWPASLENGTAAAPDLVLPWEALADTLRRYAGHLQRADAGDTDTPLRVQDGLEEIASVLLAREAFDIRHYKPNTVRRRLARRMRLLDAVSLQSYLETLQESPEERRQLCRDLLINVTEFFRDPGAFSYLQRRIVPQIFRNMGEDEPIRIWVAGCATGEEAYTVAMLMLESRDRRRRSNAIQIFATDLDEGAIWIARRGQYGDSIAGQVPQALLDKHFTYNATTDTYTVRNEVRDLISFAVQNAAADPPFNRMHLINCRNLLIYLKREIQDQVLRAFYFSLHDRGFLMLGTSETVGSRNPYFRAVSKKWRIFQKVPGLDATRLVLKGSAGERLPRLPASPSRASLPETPSARSDKLRKRLPETFLAPAVVVDGHGNVVYNQGNWAPFMALRTGEPRSEIGELLLPELRVRTRTALHKVQREGGSVSFRCPLPGHAGTGGRIAHVSVAALGADEPGLIGITFRDVPAQDSAAPAQGSDYPPDQDLSRELAETREQLQSAIEELEANNEELKAAHEQTLSTNEELQSANEELEASSEELRSLNEELSTVNAQLKTKIDQLQIAHDDLENFFASTHVPTLFLNPQLEIQRFTPAAAQLLGLTGQDVGRPVSYLGADLVGADLVQACQRVMQRFDSIHTPIDTTEGRRYIRQLSPYRTRDRRIEGVVLVFQDVTEINALVERATSRERQQAAVAQLGMQALAGVDPKVLMDQAVRQVAHVLEADLCKVLRYEPEQQHLVLEAGTGWDPGLVGVATVGSHQDSQAGYTLLSRAPVIVTDLATERRFSGPDLLISHGVVSGMSCVIGNSEEQYGVLGVHTTHHRKFTQEDANFLVSVANMLSTALRSQDVHERLHQSEQQFRTLANTIPQLAWMSDPDGRILWRNQRWFEFTGVPPDRAPPTLMRSIIHPDHAERVNSGFNSHLLAGEEWEDTFPLRGADGADHWFLSRAIPLRDATGRITNWFGTHTDITDRRRREFEVLASEEKLRLAIATSHIGAFEYFLHREETHWDPLLKQIWGVTEQETPTQQIFWEGVHPDDVKLVQQKLDEATDPAGTGMYQATYRVVNRQTGALSWVEATGRTLPPDHPERVVGMLIDVTAQRELETSLHLAVEELKETDRKKNDFLSVLGHELRNPLGALSNSIHLLKMEGVGQEVRDKALGVMSRSVSRMAKLLDDLLDLNRVSHNKVHLDNVPVDLHDLLSNVVNAAEAGCQRKGQTLSSRFEGGGLVVSGDPTRLEQVFSNLLINANKFTPQGGTIELTASRQSDQVIVTVSDNGVGIDPELLGSVFDPFFQAPSDTISDAGLGLGLALARELVERHDGTIRADSAGPGQGCTFTVTLPAAAGVPAIRGGDLLPVPPGLKVVLIEDNSDIAWSMTRLLRSVGSQVMTAETAGQGLRLAAAHEPDVVLVDIGLPDLSGYQVAEMLRERQQHALLVALSGYSHDEARRRSREAGFHHHLAKPVQLQDLADILATLPEKPGV